MLVLTGNIREIPEIMFHRILQSRATVICEYEGTETYRPSQALWLLPSDDVAQNLDEP